MAQELDRGPCPLEWFARCAPQAITSALKAGYKVYDFTARPGDVVYIPSGWWHAVLNLTDTIAVTQNFVSDANLEDARAACIVEEPELADLWLPALDMALSRRRDKI